MMKARFWLVPMAVSVISLWTGCSDDSPTRSVQTDEEAIRAMFAGVKQETETHDLEGFMSYIHPDFLHSGMDRTQLGEAIADPEEGLNAVRTITFEISNVAVTGDRATVSARVTVEFSGGGRDVSVEPSYVGGPGWGWLARRDGRWLIYGGHKYCDAFPAVGHTDDVPPADYVLVMKVRSDKTIGAAVVTGPGVEETPLEPWEGGESREWGASLTPSRRPVVGDLHTFRVDYADGKKDTLAVPIRAIIGYLPPFTVSTPDPGMLRIDWPDSSSRVAAATYYKVWAKSDREPDFYGSPDLPLTQRSWTQAGLPSGYSYRVRLMIFDAYRNYACRTQEVVIR